MMSLPVARIEPGSRPLANERHERFAQEYIVDLVGAAAYQRAGYLARGESARSAAMRLMSNEAVQERVAYLQRERGKRLGIAQDRVLVELARIGLSDVRRVASWGPEGLSVKPSDELDDDAAACIAEVSQLSTRYGPRVRLKFHDKTRALELLGKHLGMFREPAPPPESERS
jgi:phage terminase small subunit